MNDKELFKKQVKETLEKLEELVHNQAIYDLIPEESERLSIYGAVSTLEGYLEKDKEA